MQPPLTGGIWAVVITAIRRAAYSLLVANMVLDESVFVALSRVSHRRQAALAI